MARSDGKYLFNVKAMSKMFRGKYIATLKEILPLEMTHTLLTALYKHNWVVSRLAGRVVQNDHLQGRKV